MKGCAGPLLLEQRPRLSAEDVLGYLAHERREPSGLRLRVKQAVEEGGEVGSAVAGAAARVKPLQRGAARIEQLEAARFGHPRPRRSPGS